MALGFKVSNYLAVPYHISPHTSYSWKEPAEAVMYAKVVDIQDMFGSE